MHDVAVVGLGPAGRSVAAACAARGLSVLALDPAPGALWRPTYGAWLEELEGLPEAVVAHRVAVPELWGTRRHRLPREYAVLDNGALQAALPLTGVEVRADVLTDEQVVALQSRARWVIDARGARPVGGAHPGGRPGPDPAAAQTAVGIVLPTAAAAPALEGAEGFLMDWRTDWMPEGSGPEAGARAYPPTFLYALPLGEDRVLLEETCLAAAPGLGGPVLRERLRRRLVRRGVSAAAIEEPLAQEVVWIPMRGRDRPPLPGTLAIGTAGRGGHPVTGYSLAHTLRAGPRLAEQLATSQAPTTVDPPRPADIVREAGLRALLRLDTEGTIALFEAFGRLSADRQRDVMARDAGAPGLLASMWQMFAGMPPRQQAALVRATLGSPRQGLRLGR